VVLVAFGDLLFLLFEVLDLLAVGGEIAPLVGGERLRVELDPGEFQRDVTGVDLEDLEPALDIRDADLDLAVEPPAPAERRINGIGQVGCRESR